MKCDEHPRYKGKTKPKVGCKKCAEVFKNAAQTKNSEKTSEAPTPKPKPAKKPEQFTIEGRLPDRILCNTANEYRAEVINMVRQVLPQYVAFTSADGGTIVLEEAGRVGMGLNMWKITSNIPALSEKKFKDALAQSKKETKTLKRGDVYFSDKLKTSIIILAYNDKEKTVFFKEWFTRELVSMDVKEFEKLELLDVIGESDLKPEIPLETKVLSYI